jgi:hypothetical protein
MEALNATWRPSEATLRVSQVGHDVAILPSALLRSRSAQIARRWRSVMNCAESVEELMSNEGREWRKRHSQVTDFVSGDNDSAESASIFDDCDTVDFLEALIDDAGSGHICKSVINSAFN